MLAAINAWAAVLLQRVLVAAASVASLLFAVPHLGYHLAHLDEIPRIDQIGNAIILSAAVALPAAALALSQRKGRPR